MQIAAEIHGFHFPFVPFVDFKSVTDKVHEGTAAVVFKAGDRTEEAALRLEKLIRQVPGKGRRLVFISESGEGVLYILVIALIPGPADQGGPGRVFLGDFFPQKGRKKGEGLPGIGEIGAVRFPILRCQGAFFRGIAQAAELGKEERRLRVIVVIVHGRHGHVQHLLCPGEGQVGEELFFMHFLQQAFTENEAAVFENLLPLQLGEEASFFYAAGKFPFHDAGNEDSCSFHGIAPVHAGDGDMVQGRGNGGVGEGSEAVFEDGEKILF